MSNFTQTVVWENAGGGGGTGIPLLVLETKVKPEIEHVPGPDGISKYDYHMNPVFLAFLPTDESRGFGVDQVFVDQKNFFGEGGVKAPDAVSQSARRRGDLAVGERQEFDAFEQPAMLGMKTSGIALAAGESVTLRFAYGYYPKDIARDASSMTDMFRDFTTTTAAAAATVAGGKSDKAEAAGAGAAVHRLSDTVAQWSRSTTSLRFPEGASNSMMDGKDLLALAQEARWHTYSLQMHSVYSGYYEEHVVPQVGICGFL